MAQSSNNSLKPELKTPDCSEMKSMTKSVEAKTMAENPKTPASPSVSREGGESSWEDQESSDNNRLEIVEPKKKKVRRKRAGTKPKMKYNNIEVPEEIIKECSSILDNTLDTKARNLNMSSSQVKMVLKSVIQSPELLAMLRNVGAATMVESDPVAAAEPKMTRAMTKKCQDVGDSVWIIPPVTPQKPPNAEIVSLFSEEFPEEVGGDDPDFTPDLDHVLSDEDSLFSLSEQGTPGASQSACSVYNTPNSVLSESRSLLTPSEFKLPKPAPSPSVARAASRVLNFEGAVTQAEGYATRSRMPLTDTTIEQLEQQFIPFDITPDMYELNCDNDDYSEFLKTLYAGQPEDNDPQAGASPHGAGIDDPTDPEFVFPVDEADFQLKDPEELRDDRATKITKKEVSELMAELLNVAGPLDSDADSDARGKRKSKQPPGSVKKKRPRVSHEPIESEDTDRAKTPAQPAQMVPLTEQQIAQLRMQVQQHTQLLTQMALLSSHSKDWTPVRDDCDTMLSQMVSKSLLTPLSVLSPDTLFPSLAALKEWDDEGSDPTLVKHNKNAKKKRHSTYHITEDLMDFMSQKNVFQFPSLLPISGLSQTVERITWQPSEDQLLSQAIQRLAPESKKFGKRHMTELSFAINSKAMPAKTPQQIQVRIKNLKQLGADDNPVKRYYEDGVAPECEQVLKGEMQLGSSLMDMVANGRRDDIPALWLTHAINSQTKIKPAKLPVISPKPLRPIIAVTPNLPPKILFQPKSPVQTISAVETAKDKSDKIDKSIFIVPNNCGMVKSDNILMSTPAQILCVDGTNGTPGSTSEPDSDTPSNAGNETIKKTEFTSPPENKFIKKGNKCTYTKSPLKAARDRILKKYTSPHKRPLREIRKRPVLHPIRMSPMKLKSIERLPITPRRLVPKAPAVSPVVSVNTSPTLCASPQPDEEDRQTDPVTDTPTGPPGKRGTRRQKEAEATLALLGDLETPEEKELRESRESAEMFEEICNTVSDNASLCEEFDHIMSVAMDVGTSQTYLSLHQLLDGHPLVQELLLDLLSPDDAIKLGFKTRVAFNQRRRMKRFVLKLGRAYHHQPAYHAKVLRELEAVSTHQNLTPNVLKQTADRLFKNNQHLLDEFLSLVPGVPTPESMLPSPEILHYPEDSDQSWASDEIQMETITCKSPSNVEEARISKEEMRPSADEPKQPCKCPEYLAKPGPCRSCNVRFVDGEVFVMDGKILKPAHVQGWGESVTTA